MVVVQIREDEEFIKLGQALKKASLVGSGDDFYPVFCSAVDDFEEQFEKAGAVKGGIGVKVNLYPEEEDEVLLRKLADDIVAKSEN